MARPQPLSRTRAEREGRRAEWLAEAWLRLKGYRILSRRFRVGAGEIDLVAARGTLLAFVEVKARPDRATAQSAITPQAERRIAAAATIWRARHRPDHDGELRYDLVTVVRGRPRHHKDVFRPEADSRDPAGVF